MKTIVKTEMEKFEARMKRVELEREKMQTKVKEDIEDGLQRTL